jgi:hypothetical protein
MRVDLMLLIAAFILTVLGQVVYHSIARAGAAARQPFELVAAAYVFALIGVLIVGFTARKISIDGMISPANLIPAFGIGLAVSLVEIGYIYAYRAGLPVGTGAVSVLAVATVVLVPIGILAFAEQITMKVVLGVACAVFGVWLMRS